MSLSGRAISLWIDTSDATDFPSLDGRIKVDIAVIGGGIAGLTAAFLLKQAGAAVAVIEAERIARGVSGHTTAKITSAHALIYDYLLSHFGEEQTRLYAEANQTALEYIARLVRERNIACDFRRTFACTYTESDQDLEKINREVQAAMRVGLPVSFRNSLPLPFPIKGAVFYEQQAQFHPRKYLLALAESIPGKGSHIFEMTRAIGLKEDHSYLIKTEKGEIEAEKVIVATHFPFLNRGLYFARMYPKRSYLMAMRAGEVPEGMYISTEEPFHSIRSQVTDSGERFLLVGGESHKTGQGGDTREHYRNLERYARERFDIKSVEYHWSTQDNKPDSRLPFIGKMTPGSRHLYVATGFQGWGMTLGTVSAMVLADMISGTKNPWISLFDPNRFTPMASAKSFVTENLNVVKEFTAGHLQIHPKKLLSDLPPGEGAVVQIGTQKVAVYKDEQENYHTVSPNCTHMGCVVSWNSAEKSWDCPCHGSRFDVDGRVLQAPAVKGLAPKEADEISKS